ncbi:tail fiber domain-containing protein [Pseudomonas putida]|uniref:tail fiber domain-containing protein n=1 Tax=Pseudomonas putida TaxID=303 RepID=UPI0018A9E822|nr:tail fiber domain-containing protein [Pseudomonas putida]MBF8764220.1 tail fiber domain-containing protein [Pseudomonas putida]
MADQTQRLEIATVRAEVGSNIVFRFANDPANADSIPTESGAIQNLKQVVLEIQQEAAEKISISTTIYTTVAAGLAATADQGIFLVQSNDADEIYTVWQNQAGTAVNTGKTALSATAIEAALEASNEAARAAEDAADAATMRTLGFLSPSASDPAVRDNGLPLQTGDRYFNTVRQVEFIYTASGWSANDSQSEIADLKAEVSSVPGSSKILRANEQGRIPDGWLSVDVNSVVEASKSGFSKKLHKKRIVAKLPIVFPDYESIQSAGGNSYLYPQGFFVDERADEILVAYNASGGTYTRNIVRYKLSTAAYISCFQLSLPAGAGGGESFAVYYNDAGNRYIASKYDGSQVAIYNITVFPANRAVLTHETLKATPMYFQISQRGGEFMMEEAGPAIGGSTSRTNFAVYNSDFKRIRTFSYTKMDSGFQSINLNAYAPFIPKAQGVALGDGYIATVHGGIVVHSDASTTNRPFGYQGPRIYSPEGRILAESICEPFKMKSIFESVGLITDRLEYEGVCVTDSGRIMTLMLHHSRFGDQAKKTGITIFEEFSSAPDAIDFSSAVYTFARSDILRTEGGIFPRGTNGMMYDPVTGDPWTTMEQIIDYMDLMDGKNIGYYQASVNITPVAGIVMDLNTEVTITNYNHVGFHVKCVSGTAVKTYEVTGSSGSRSAKLLRNDASGLRLATEASGSVDRLHRMVGESRDSTAPDVLFSDLQALSGNTDLRIGGGSSAFRGCTQLRFFTAPDVSSGTVERWQINSAGVLRPLADNSYSLGLANARPSQLFAATSTIGTSDERLKTQIADIPDEILDAWEAVEYTQFKFIDAVDAKGSDGARMHFGVIAQRVRQAFEERGIDALSLGLLCLDSWDATPDEVECWDAVLDSDGTVISEAGSRVTPGISAGDRYGIRYEEALVLEAALMRRTTRHLKARLALLEDKAP